MGWPLANCNYCTWCCSCTFCSFTLPSFDSLARLPCVPPYFHKFFELIRLTRKPMSRHLSTFIFDWNPPTHIHPFLIFAECIYRVTWHDCRPYVLYCNGSYRRTLRIHKNIGETWYVILAIRCTVRNHKTLTWLSAVTLGGACLFLLFGFIYLYEAFKANSEHVIVVPDHEDPSDLLHRLWWSRVLFGAFAISFPKRLDTYAYNSRVNYYFYSLFLSFYTHYFKLMQSFRYETV